MDCSHQDLGSDSSNLFDFKDFKNPVDPILKYDENKYDDTLLIDNGKMTLAQYAVVKSSVIRLNQLQGHIIVEWVGNLLKSLTKHLKMR